MKPLLSKVSVVAQLRFAKLQNEQQNTQNNILQTDDTKVKTSGGVQRTTFKYQHKLWSTVVEAWWSGHLSITEWSMKCGPSVWQLKLGSNWVMQQDDDHKHSWKRKESSCCKGPFQTSAPLKCFGGTFRESTNVHNWIPTQSTELRQWRRMGQNVRDW